jgi:hypothetical protein
MSAFSVCMSCLAIMLSSQLSGPVQVPVRPTNVIDGRAASSVRAVQAVSIEEHQCVTVAPFSVSSTRKRCSTDVPAPHLACGSNRRTRTTRGGSSVWRALDFCVRERLLRGLRLSPRFAVVRSPRARCRPALRVGSAGPPARLPGSGYGSHRFRPMLAGRPGRRSSFA